MSDSDLRQQLRYLLSGVGAHLDFDAAVAGLPPQLRGAKVQGSPHTPWRLVEHMRICQWDILQFSTSAKHVSPEFPDGYWPATDGPPTDIAWEECLAQFRADLDAMKGLVRDETTDLFAPIPHGDGQTILREAFLVADHNAYHLGQFVFLRRVLGAWPNA